MANMLICFLAERYNTTLIKMTIAILWRVKCQTLFFKWEQLPGNKQRFWKGYWLLTGFFVWLQQTRCNVLISELYRCW